MSRLFDRYLAATVKKKVPMPVSWLQSLGLGTDGDAYYAVEGGYKQVFSGYQFEQDETLERGFISSRLFSSALDGDSTYQVAMYLRAIKTHLGKDFISYFNAAVVEKPTQFKYITRIPVVEGEKYTIFGHSELPLTWRYYSEISDTEFAKGEIGFIANPYLINTSLYMVPPEYEEEQEYFMLEVTSYASITILPGSYNRWNNYVEENDTSQEIAPFKRTVQTDKAGMQALTIPSLTNGGRYSDKLIPALLDMQVTERSSKKLIDLVSLQLVGEASQTVGTKIKNNTEGIYDVDEYIGRNLRW